MQLRFDEWSKLEFKEARAWYAAIRPALGRAFADEVKLAGQRCQGGTLPGRGSEGEFVVVAPGQLRLSRALRIDTGR